jgi:hypothetical protein
MKGTSFEAMVVVLRNEAMEYVEDVNDGAQSDSLGSAKTSTNEMRRVSHLPKRDLTFSRHYHLQDYIQTWSVHFKHRACHLGAYWCDSFSKQGVSDINIPRGSYRFQTHAGNSPLFRALNPGPAFIN